MDSPAPLIAHRSGRSTLRAFVGGAVMTVVGVAVAIYAPTKWGGIGIGVSLLLALCSVFFGAVTVYLGVRLLSKRPMLVVDGNGILDRTALFGVGQLRWDEVVSARFRTDTNPPFVSVDVTDPEAVLARQGPLRRLAIRLGARRWGVVVINSGALDVPAKAVVDAIEGWVRQRSDRST